jgi:hypothetical protein
MTIYDHCYFYIKDKYGHYTCGLARDTMARMLRKHGADVFMDQIWLDSFVHFKANRSVLGFLVEEACLSSIAQIGLKVAGLGLDSLKTIVFEQFPIYDTSIKQALYIPYNFNHEAIDGLILKVNEEKNEAYIIPIQITIAKKHSKSEDKFFNNWKNWTSGLTKYNIKTTFLWITENKPLKESVMANDRTTRQATTIINPQYQKVVVTVREVNQNIGDSLKMASDCN